MLLIVLEVLLVNVVRIWYELVQELGDLLESASGEHERLEGTVVLWDELNDLNEAAFEVCALLLILVRN